MKSSIAKNEKYSSNFSLKLYNLCQRLPFLRKLKVILYFTDSFLLLFLGKPKKLKSERKKIIIIYNYAFGDGVIWLCSAKAFRKIYPKDKYEITLICQKGINSLYENEGIFDKVIPFNLTASTFNMKERYKLFKKLREVHYDIVLDPIGVYECTTNIYMSRAIIAKEKISILDVTLENKMCPDWMLNRIYTKIINVNKAKLSLIEYYAEFIRGLGYKEFKVKLEKLLSLKKGLDLPEKYFIVFPSASTLLKRWPVERYVEIAHKIYDKTKLPILLCGTKDDAEIINEFKSKIGDIPIYDFVSRTSLLEFIEVVRMAKLVITNDTSTYHIAVVSEIPVAIVTGGYTYDRYVAYNFENMNKQKKPCIIVHNMDCFNCDNKCCLMKNDTKIWPCLDKITVDYAWKKIEKLINDNKIGG